MTMIQKLRRLLACVFLALLALPALAVTTDIYYHNDLAGTPMAATDGAGNLLWRQGYKPYGERLDPKAPADQLPWFTGKAHVEAAGLSYFGARWYDPALGRFMGLDPSGFSEANLHSFNRYAYANNNPYKFVDPDGRSAEEIFANWPIAPLGKFAGAAAAWAQGVATGNAALRAEGAAGMAENRGGAVEAAVVIGSVGRVARSSLGASEGRVAVEAGGGARLENLPTGDALRIQNAVNRAGVEVSVVGSRAAGTSKPSSDWDYILGGGTSSARHSVKSSLPEGPRTLGEPSNRDIHSGPLDKTKPYITFSPRSQ